MRENHTGFKSGKGIRWRDGAAVCLLFLLVAGASVWVGRSLREGRVTVWEVGVAAAITAAATGFGAVPFLFTGGIDKRWLGVGNSLAAGLMLGASLGLLVEGATLGRIVHPEWRVAAGAMLGWFGVVLAHRLLTRRDHTFSIGDVRGANAARMLMIVGVMTVHSFAEGMGVGVSFGEDGSFGGLIAVSIAIHNIPEGLAISLVLVPRGTSVRQSALWGIFSSLPQPLVAVPAFLFVLMFRPLLPLGLGLAAGAMIRMVFFELLPDAREHLALRWIAALSLPAAAAMMAFQFLA